MPRHNSGPDSEEILKADWIGRQGDSWERAVDGQRPPSVYGSGPDQRRAMPFNSIPVAVRRRGGKYSRLYR